MGCCSSRSKFQIELPFDRLEEYNKIKQEIEDFLNSEDPLLHKDSNKILDLLIKTSNLITKYEKDLEMLKKNKNNSDDIGDDLIEGINKDIKLLKEDHTKLNNLMKESQNVIQNENIENFNENNNNINDNIVLKNENNLSSERKGEKENSSSIYFKKPLRRNKKGILNQKLNYGNKNELIQQRTSENENDLLNNNFINLIFELENGKRLEIETNKENKLIEVIIKLCEEENNEYNDINLLDFYDGDNLLNDKIENGDKIEDFEFNDNHLIIVKFKEKNDIENENNYINYNDED